MPAEVLAQFYKAFLDESLPANKAYAKYVMPIGHNIFVILCQSMVESKFRAAVPVDSCGNFSPWRVDGRNVGQLKILLINALSAHLTSFSVCVCVCVCVAYTSTAK